MWKKMFFWKIFFDCLSIVFFKIFGENLKIFLIKLILFEMNCDVIRLMRVVREIRKLYENCGRLYIFNWYMYEFNFESEWKEFVNMIK